MTNTKPIHSCVFTHALKQVLHLIMCLTCAEALKKLKFGDVMLMQHMAPVVLEIHLKHVEEFISFVGITLFCKVKDALPWKRLFLSKCILSPELHPIKT